MKRSDGRAEEELRKVRIRRGYLRHAEGSVLIEAGETRVICSATVEDRIPAFRRESGGGWVTAEYGMLPRSSQIRIRREIGSRGVKGRTQEIQRLIGRSLRAATDLTGMGERTIMVDCDVLQADGGTRSAAITGGCVALALALKKLLDQGSIERMPLRHLAAAVSVGVVSGEPRLDLDYKEDSRADLDMNVVQTDTGSLIEVQASAERDTFERKTFSTLLDLADLGITRLIRMQKELLKSRSMMFMAYSRPDRS